MANATIPVDLLNPGQVFACLGFMEAAEILCGDAEGGFSWEGRASHGEFTLEASGDRNPIEVVIEFLAGAEVVATAPVGWTDPEVQIIETFPASEADRMALPCLLRHGDGRALVLSHWADGTKRNTFKLYAGNRTAAKIATDMLAHIGQLWTKHTTELVAKPLHCLIEVGGSFNLDPRGAWTALDVGYSLNDQDHEISSSPIVELLAALGLQNARPNERALRQIEYCTWLGRLPVSLARAVIGGATQVAQTRCFAFELALSGKNKVVTIAAEETL